jgi:ketosteroid isomerase-like protein
MSTEANREAIRRAFVAWQDEGAPITDAFAPEMTWRIEGRSVVAGDYANRQEFIDRVRLRVVHDLARRAGGQSHRVLRPHRVRRALATLRRRGHVRLRQESRKPGAGAQA